MRRGNLELLHDLLQALQKESSPFRINCEFRANNRTTQKWLAKVVKMGLAEAKDEQMGTRYYLTSEGSSVLSSLQPSVKFLREQKAEVF